MPVPPLLAPLKMDPDSLVAVFEVSAIKEVEVLNNERAVIAQPHGVLPCAVQVAGSALPSAVVAWEKSQARKSRKREQARG